VVAAPVPTKKPRVPEKLARKLSPRRRSALSTLVLMVKAFFGSLFDPNYTLAPKKQANVHTVYDNADQTRGARSHIGASDVPTSFGSGGG